MTQTPDPSTDGLSRRRNPASACSQGSQFTAQSGDPRPRARMALTGFVVLCATLVVACGDPPRDDLEDAGQCASPPCQDIDDPPTEDVTGDPDTDEEDELADADAPIPTLPPLTCTELVIEGECVPESFIGRDDGPIQGCPEGLRKPIARDASPTCSGVCRGPQTAPVVVYEGVLGEPIHSPVDGVVVEVVTDKAARPDPTQAESCGEDEAGRWCCRPEDGEGNTITIEDRKRRRWTLAHLAPQSAVVAPGQVVEAGALIAAMGDSGFLCAPPQSSAAQVALSVRSAELARDPSSCDGEPADGPAPGDCFDMDGDTYGQGPGCATLDCDDEDPSLQSWGAQRRGCLGADGARRGCADRDGDGAFAGAECPWPDEDCDDLDASTRAGCQGQPCECRTGPCCDGCLFLGPETLCAESVGISYLCQDGTGCGSDVYARLEDRVCSGTSSACDGPTEVRAPTLTQQCRSDQRCREGGFQCAFDADCTEPCADDDACAPDQHCFQGQCLDDLCPQNETFCVGNALRACDARGRDSDQVESCAFGCAQGQCLPCPDDFCSRQGLNDGEHCDGDALVQCTQEAACRLEAQRTPCADPTPLCLQGRCVACDVDEDCPSPLQGCEAQRCVCEDTCEVGEQGCLPDGQRWQCAPDEGGCLHRVLAPCGEFEICEDGACENFCPPSFCSDEELLDGEHCDGVSRVRCGQAQSCPVELERVICRDETPLCAEGACVQCVEDGDCPSPQQRCEGAVCVCDDACEVGAVGCDDEATSWTCVSDEAGCGVRQTQACGGNEVCQAGVCELNCPTNFCQDNGLGQGEHCDGDRRVECRTQDRCARPRTDQRCGCGCTEGACDPCDEPDGPALEIGLGVNDFMSVSDGAVAGIYAGFQGGHHVFGALRVRGLTAGLSTQQTWRIVADGEELARWTAFRELRPNGEVAQWSGETVQLTLGTDPATLDGRAVTLSLTLITLDDDVLFDDVDLTLAWPP